MLAGLMKRVVLVSGKGGVGRTTVSIALARAAVANGKRVLLCELQDQENTESALGRALGGFSLSENIRSVQSDLNACLLSSRYGHIRFLTSLLPAKALITAALKSRALQVFLNSAPSFFEMGIFYHFLELYKAKEADGSYSYDMIIIDMPATGHALALTGLPEILLRLIPGGPIARLLREGQAYLNDPQVCAAWIVSLAEQLPVSEALELLAGLQKTNVPVGGLVLNRLETNPFNESEMNCLDALGDVDDLLGARIFRNIQRMQVQVERLRKSVQVPIVGLKECKDGAQNLFDVLAVELNAAENLA